MYANNLLGITDNFLTPGIVNKFSDAIGETTDRTQKALKTVIPTLLLGIVNKAGTNDGAETLVNIVHKDALESEKIPHYSDTLYISKGSDAIQGIFGNDLNSVVSNLGESTGIQTVGIEKMLKMAAPIVMGFLSTKIKQEELSTPGVMGFLGQQKTTLSHLVPDGLIGGFMAKTQPGDQIIRTASPWTSLGLAVLIILSGLWWYNGMKGFHEIASVPGSMSTSTVHRIVTFLKSGAIDLPQSFKFENVKFKTNSSELLQSSTLELDQVANVLKDFSLVKIRIESYSAVTGSEATNRDLSGNRAQAVKAQLVERGINRSRIESVGLGSDQNERINLVITRIE